MKSSSAKQLSGVSVNRITVLAMAASGAFAGVAGAIEVLGVRGRLVEGFSPGYGFEAIAIALLGRLHPLGIVAAAPPVPVLPSAMPVDGKALTAVIAVVLTFALAWLLWRVLIRRLGWSARPDGEVAGLSLLLIALALAVVVWVSNPFTALLLLPALHLWLLLASPELRPRRPLALALALLALAPLGLLIAFYAHQLGLGVGPLAWMTLLLLAGGHIPFAGAVLWSVALGCAAAAAILAAGPSAPPLGPQAADGLEVTIRGPMSYAGPGSLGGTESALRR